MKTHSRKRPAPAVGNPRLEPATHTAARTGIPYTTWRDIAHRGEIPIVRVGRAWYFDRADVDRWIETRKERVEAPGR